VKTVAFMPIKLNNQRLSGKNTRMLRDKPLCQWALNELLELKNDEAVEEVYVYCSDPKIEDYLPNGVELLLRNPSLDHPHVQGNDIYRSFIAEVPADLYMLHHATSPFVKVETLYRCLTAVSSGKHDSALTVKEMHGRFWRNNAPVWHDLETVGRTQDMTPVYFETEACYVFPPYLLEIYGRRVGFNPYLCPVDAKEAIDIDTRDDFELAQCVAWPRYASTNG